MLRLFVLISLVSGLWASDASLIVTVAGNGAPGYSGDGGAAVNASLYDPVDSVFDAAGNLYIVEAANHVVRKVSPTGAISTLAGTGMPGFSGDGGPAASAMLWFPNAIAIDGSGNLYIAEVNNQRVRKINLASGIITTVAGNGTRGFFGDGGPATSANLCDPIGVAADSAGNLFISDVGNQRIRRVDAATGIITTYAGGGSSMDEGAAAISALLDSPYGLALDAVGNLFYVDQAQARVRRIDAATQTVTTFAGSLVNGFSGDGGPATQASLSNPFDVALDSTGNVYIADTGNSRVRRVDSTGVITTVAGPGEYPTIGDGGPATSAFLNSPAGVRLDSVGHLYIADELNQRIRQVTFFAPTTTSLTSSLNPANVGQQLTYTASVTPAQATGGVEFLDRGSSLGTVTLVNGSASISFRAAGSGAHSITASYSGDSQYQSSVSAALSETVNLNTTTTSVSASPNPALQGQPVTLTATVSPASATGTIQFIAAGSPIGTVPVSGGTAQLVFTPGAAGAYVNANYSGDAAYAASSGTTIAQVLRTTATSLGASPNPATFGQTVNLSGTVSAVGATGTVQILDGSAVIGSTTVSGGNFALSIVTLTAGAHSLRAAYLGDSLYASSTSTAISETVNKATAGATLSSSLNPSAVGQAVIFTAHVVPSAATGSVSFYDGSTLLGTGTLSGGVASFSTSSLARGTHSIKAVYSGDANVNGATSAVLSQTVKQK
jgi:sugar lactone lactonase YvrE